MRSFNVFDGEVTFDPSDPEPYRAGMRRFGPDIGARRMGATLYELPPGQALCPYHYESEEEWLLVLQGRLTGRHPRARTSSAPATSPRSRSARPARTRRRTTAPRPCASSWSRRAIRS